MALEGSRTRALPSMGRKGCLPTFGDAGEFGLGDTQVVELQAIEGSRFKATVLQRIPAHL